MTQLGPKASTPPRVLVVIGTRPEAIKMAPVVRALAAEEVITGRVYVTAQHRQMLDQVLRHRVEGPFGFLDPARRLILVTGHRRENFGAGFERICRALATLAQRPDIQILYPVHLNPNVQKPVRRLLGGVDNIHLISRTAMSLTLGTWRPPRGPLSPSWCRATW